MSFVDRMIEKLEVGTTVSEKDRAELLKRLQELYVLQGKGQKEIESEAKRLPYAHLRAEAEELAREEKKHQETTSELIRNAGGKEDDSALQNYEPVSEGEFSEILRIENQLEDKFIEHANWAEEKGFHHEARVLRELKEAHYKCVEKIERLIMRTNGAM